jgi:hypothetical protein
MTTIQYYIYLELITDYYIILCKFLFFIYIIYIEIMGKTLVRA